MSQDKETQKRLITEIMEADAKDGLYEQKTTIEHLVITKEPIHYQVFINDDDGNKLAYKKDDVWTIEVPIEQVLDKLIEIIKKLSK